MQNERYRFYSKVFDSIFPLIRFALTVPFVFSAVFFLIGLVGLLVPALYLGFNPFSIASVSDFINKGYSILIIWVGIPLVLVFSPLIIFSSRIRLSIFSSLNNLESSSDKINRHDKMPSKINNIDGIYEDLLDMEISSNDFDIFQKKDNSIVDKVREKFLSIAQEMMSKMKFILTYVSFVGFFSVFMTDKYSNHDIIILNNKGKADSEFQIHSGIIFLETSSHTILHRSLLFDTEASHGTEISQADVSSREIGGLLLIQKNNINSIIYPRLDSNMDQIFPRLISLPYR